ncbi:MAG: 3-deoxy-D-manno-octulosonic acid transferase, partial [Chitinophagaceae bacterium]|nr:3-deoxy-D-manno-octulosonic acid transferase [Chitinophagaceae bacterium]
MKGAALFYPKAKAWVKGRIGLLPQLERSISKDDRVIWMHVASLGEFEQGRPLLEKIKRTY